MFRKFVCVASGLALYLVMNSAVAELVVVVSTQNPITGLTSEELEDIFLGRHNRYPNGEPAEPVEVDNLESRREFYGSYLGRTTAQIRTYWARQIFTGRGRPPRSVPDGTAAADYVVKHPHAISYLDSSIVDERLRVVPIE
jgi:hypothetical protein